MSEFPLPLRVCVPCGNLYRRRPGTGLGITVSMDECAVCGEQKMCAPDYDFGGLRPEWKDHGAKQSDRSTPAVAPVVDRTGETE